MLSELAAEERGIASGCGYGKGWAENVRVRWEGRKSGSMRGAQSVICLGNSGKREGDGKAASSKVTRQVTREQLCGMGEQWMVRLVV